MNYLPALLLVIISVYSTDFTAEAKDQSRILIHGEYGSFNKVYEELEYKDNPASTFPVSMVNYGMEYRHKSSSDYTIGTGLVGTEISEGKKFNYDHYEIQPHVSIILPYLFIGNEFHLWSLEAGLSYFLTFQKIESRHYYLSDGSSVERDSGGTALYRRETYVLINFLIRILPENSFHLKLKYGRERFHIIDSLFTASAIYPYKSHIFEAYAALSTYVSSYTPKSNQRFGIVYSYCFGSFVIGLTAGYLGFNHLGGGDGNMYIFDPHNFSVGSSVEIRW